MSCLAEQEISLVEGVRTSLLLCAGFSCYEAQPLCSQASVACGLSSCDLLAPSYLGFSSCPHRLISCDSHSGPRVCLAVALRLSVPQYVESSQTRERSCVPRIGRWILIHCTTGNICDGCLHQANISVFLRNKISLELLCGAYTPHSILLFMVGTTF